MDWFQQCAVVIPCRNEAMALGHLVRAVRRHLPHVIVVNDGSTDATAKEAEEAGAEVIHHDKPRGKGEALRSGWRRAADLGFAWILTMDGDGQHAPDDIPRFLECADQTGAALVSGNRMVDAERMPLVRRLVNWWMSRRLSSIAGRDLPDTQCGFRLCRLEALLEAHLRAGHYEIESEQLLAFAHAGKRIEFVPIRVIYREERSKIRPLRDTVRWFRWLRQWQRQHPSAREG